MRELIVALKFYDTPFHAIEPPEIASKSVLKTDLTIMIRDFIESQGWTQKEAAKKLGVSQPRISNILNGKIDKFTLDCLFSMLDKLGYNIESSLNKSGKNFIEILPPTLPTLVA